jgi:hypothetical protein
MNSNPTSRPEHEAAPARGENTTGSAPGPATASPDGVADEVVTRVSQATPQGAIGTPTMPDGLAEFVTRRAELPTAASVTRIRGSLDWILFVAFLVPGFLLIFFLKQFGVDAIVVAGIAAGSIVVYGVLAYFLPSVRVRPDRLGDNVYYMGFVFTLASMSAAILDLQSGANITALIGGFGIALFSTIVGVAGRVLLLQMRTEVEDIEELVRRDLIDQAGKLRGQLSAAVHDLEIFRLGVQHSLEQRLNEAFAAHEASLEQQLRKLDSLTEEVTENIQKSFRANETSSANLREAATESADALRALVKRFGQINPASDLIDKKLAGTMARVEKVIAEFERAATSAAERQRTLDEAAAGLNAIVGVLQSDIGRFAEAAETLGRAGAPVGQLGTTFQAFAAQIEAARAALVVHQDTAARAQAQQQAVVTALTTSEAALAALNSALAGVAETAGGTAAALGASIHEVTKALDANRANLLEFAAQSGSLRERIAADIDASLGALAAVPKAVADLKPFSEAAPPGGS